MSHATSPADVDRRSWRNPAPRLGLAVLAIAFALAGCTTTASGGGGSGEAEGQPAPAGTGADGTVSTTASPVAQSPTADDFNKLLASEDGLVDVQQVEILGVDETGPGALLVSFEMASHHCYGVHAAVTETDTAVTLDLHTGRRDGVASAACPLGVFPYTTQVTLAAPLGEREVVTGAEPSATAGATTATTTGATGTAPAAGAGLDPAQIDPAAIPVGDIDRYVGRHVEDGVEWALANERAWRIVSEDGTSLADGSAEPERLSFTVVADVIVGYEWS